MGGVFFVEDISQHISFFCSVRFQHRRSSYKELQYICDGDNNGVLYFAGTSYGEHQWVNPVLAKVEFSKLYYNRSAIHYKTVPHPIEVPCFRQSPLQLAVLLQDSLTPRFWPQELTRYDESKFVEVFGSELLKW